MEAALKIVSYVFGKYAFLPTPTPTLKVPMCTVPGQPTDGPFPPATSYPEPHRMVAEEIAENISAAGILGLVMTLWQFLRKLATQLVSKLS